MPDKIQKMCALGYDIDQMRSPSSGFWAGCPNTKIDLGNSAYEVFDDFTTLSVSSTTTGKWVLNNTNGSAILTSAEAFDGTNEYLGGVLKLGTDGTLPEDYASMKVASANTGAPFKITEDSGKKLWFAVKIYVSSITDCSYYVGLFDQTVTEPGIDDDGTENLSGTQDGVYFRTVNTTPTEIDFCAAADGDEVEAKGAIGTLAASSWITLGLYFNGISGILAYINGVEQNSIGADQAYFPGASSDQGLTPFLYVKEGAGTATYLYCDWIKCVQIR